MGKTTMYLAGISAQVREEIETKFTLTSGSLPIRYLGLPLVTRRLTATDYQPLLEQIRNRINSWTARYLTFAGRLNLISSILWSIASFWLAAYRLPRQCLCEIDSICSSFLWSGVDMNTHKAKLSWKMVCKPKREGGLGLRPLNEINDVCSLKLIWWLVSNQFSLWVNWIQTYLIRQSSFWAAKKDTQAGSWMWKKLLKCRDIVRVCCRMEVNNG